MKTFEQFINEDYNAINYNDKVLTLEDLAEFTARLQGPEGANIMKPIILKIYQDILNKGDNIAVKKKFEKDTDLQLRPIAKGKFQIIYDTEKRFEKR